MVGNQLIVNQHTITRSRRAVYGHQSGMIDASFGVQKVIKFLLFGGVRLYLNFLFR